MEKLDTKLKQHLALLLQRYPQLQSIENSIIEAYLILEECFSSGGKLLIAGNGGSASDAQHIVGELMKSFVHPRTPDPELCQALQQIDLEMGAVLSRNIQGALPAIALDGHTSLNTAFINDCNPLLCFAQQVNGYGNKDDVFWGITTSGNSQNILYAATMAKAKGLKVIGLTGKLSSKLSQLADACIQAPETETYMVQELHLPIYHTLCLMLEEHFFPQ